MKGVFQARKDIETTVLFQSFQIHQASFDNWGREARALFELFLDTSDSGAPRPALLQNGVTFRLDEQFPLLFQGRRIHENPHADLIAGEVVYTKDDIDFGAGLVWVKAHFFHL